MDEKALRRFRGSYDVVALTGCWLWRKYVGHNGYAYFNLGPKKLLAHRMAYEHYRGPIPEGLCIDHLCRVRHCVNSEHMEAVTTRENIMRGVAPSARNAVKTHCLNGHELSGDNLGVRPSGWRDCKQCNRDRARESNARARAEQLKRGETQKQYKLRRAAERAMLE